MFKKEIAIPQQELMFLIKNRKSSTSSLRFRKTAPEYFCFQISLNLSISYTFQDNSRRVVLLENSYSWNIYLFFQLFLAKNLWKISVEFLKAIVLLLPATLLKVKVLQRYFSNTLNTVVKHMLWGTNFYGCNWMTNTSPRYCFC